MPKSVFALFAQKVAARFCFRATRAPRCTCKISPSATAIRKNSSPCVSIIAKLAAVIIPLLPRRIALRGCHPRRAPRRFVCDSCATTLHASPTLKFLSPSQLLELKPEHRQFRTKKTYCQTKIIPPLSSWVGFIGILRANIISCSPPHDTPRPANRW